MHNKVKPRDRFKNKDKFKNRDAFITIDSLRMISHIRSNLFSSNEDEFNDFVWAMLKTFDRRVTIPENIGTRLFGGIFRDALSENYLYFLSKNKRYDQQMGLYFIYSLSECLFYSAIRKKYKSIHLESIRMGSQHVAVSYHEGFAIRMSIYPMKLDEFSKYVTRYDETTDKLINKVVYPLIDTCRNGVIRGDKYLFGVWDVCTVFGRISSLKNNPEKLQDMLFDLYERIIKYVWPLGLVYDDLKYGNIGILDDKLYIIDYEFEDVTSKLTGSITITNSPIKNHYLHNFSIMLALMIIIEDTIKTSDNQTIYEVDYNEYIGPLLEDLPNYATSNNNYDKTRRQTMEYCLQKLDKLK